MSSAREAAERIIKLEGLTFALACLPPQKELAAAREILRDAIAAAILAEREECAKVADGYLGADVIAAAIRARQ